MALVELTAEMTRSELIAALNTNLNFLSNRFRIGDTITTRNPENPGLYFGGTWELTSEGLMTVGYKADDPDFGEVGATGGDKNLQAHKHQQKFTNISVQTGSTQIPVVKYLGETSATSDAQMENAGTGTGGNMPPYEVKYVWERVA